VLSDSPHQGAPLHRAEWRPTTPTGLFKVFVFHNFNDRIRSGHLVKTLDPIHTPWVKLIEMMKTLLLLTVRQGRIDVGHTFQRTSCSIRRKRYVIQLILAVNIYCRRMAPNVGIRAARIVLRGNIVASAPTIAEISVNYPPVTARVFTVRNLDPSANGANNRTWLMSGWPLACAGSGR